MPPLPPRALVERHGLLEAAMIFRETITVEHYAGEGEDRVRRRMEKRAREGAAAFGGAAEWLPRESTQTRPNALGDPHLILSQRVFLFMTLGGFGTGTETYRYTGPVRR